MSVALKCSGHTDGIPRGSAGLGGSKGQMEHLVLSPTQAFSSTELGLFCFKAANQAKFPIPFQIKLNVLLMGLEILMNFQDFCFLHSD